MQNPRFTMDSSKHGAEVNLEELRSDHTVLKSELMKIRQQQDDILRGLDSARERLSLTETKQKQMIVFLIKSLKNPTFLQHFVHRRRRAVSHGRILKKRRLADGRLVEAEAKATKLIYENELVIQSENRRDEPDGSDGATFQQLANSEWNGIDMDMDIDDCSSENFVLWEKLMEDNMIYEGEHGDMQVRHHSEIVTELENLISEPTTEWGLGVRTMVEPVGCRASTA